MSRVSTDEAGLSPLGSRMEVAIDWMVLLTSGHADDVQKADFEIWLSIDARNAEAWRRIEKLLAQPVEQLRQVSNRVPVNTAFVQQITSVQPAVTRRKLLRGGVALTAMVSAGALWQASGEQVDYRTDVGERQHRRLADGSWLDMNACSSLQDLSDNRRCLRLLQGQMLIDVAQQTTPFLIKTDHCEVEANGRVMVWRDRNRSLVAALTADSRVLHGRGSEQLLHPGDAVWVEKSGLRKHQGSSPFASTAWVDGVLDVTDASLGDVIRLLKPYLPGYVRVSPAAAELRVFGVFQLDQPALLGTLAEVLPIRVARLGSWVANVDLANS
jgi:transmembrane sensor